MEIKFTSGAEEYFPSKIIQLEKSDIEERKIHKIKDIIKYLYEKYPLCREKLFSKELSLCPGMLCCLDE
ncbi:hypothetical protein H311_00808, partial [Anncaliia algerae PRA109]